MRIKDTIFEIIKEELSTLIEPSKIDQLIMNTDMKLQSKCIHIMDKGKRIGEKCDRSCPGKNYCKLHFVLYHGKQCEYVKKKRCNKYTFSNFCNKHSDQKEDSTPNYETDSVLDQQEDSIPNHETDSALDQKEDSTPNHETDSVPEQQVNNVFEKQPRYKNNKPPALQIYEDLVPKYRNKIEYDTNVIPYEEHGSDNDNIIDRSDLTELYSNNLTWGCQYWNKSLKSYCLEDTVINNQFCVKHKKEFNKNIPFKIGPHGYSMLEAEPTYFKIHEFSGQYWYPQLLLAAKPTTEGLVVIGRLIGHRWLKELTRREIKRCQNNGLLYKIIPQDILHFNYSIPSIETLKGQGFTNYDQIRFNRPKLYIKYWNIWNEHIIKRKTFIKDNEKITDPIKWQKEHNCPLPEWEELKKNYNYRGYNNIIIPPPTLENCLDKEFDPWKYCDEWVLQNLPNEKDKPHFPPMFIDHVSPYSMRFRPYNNISYKEKHVNVHTPRRTKHYKRDPTEWIEKITTGGGEWLQIYF